MSKFYYLLPVTGGALMARLLRLVGWLALFGAFLAGVFISWIWSGGRDGLTPSGPLPMPITLVLAGIVGGANFALHPTWVSFPFLSCMTFAVLWRFIPKDLRRETDSWFDRHTTSLVLFFLLGLTAYVTAARYDHRTGPADLAIYNKSAKTLQNVRFEIDSAKIDVGILLPFERKFLHVHPHSDRENVCIRFDTEGTTHLAEFSGGIGNDRQFYYMYSLSETLQGEFNAWPAVDYNRWKTITVTNKSGRPLTQVLVQGLGWQIKRDKMEADESFEERVLSLGPATLSLAFETEEV